jgi:hypothetical protein
VSEITHELDENLVNVEGVLFAIQEKVLEYLNAIELFGPIENKFHEDSKTIEDDLNKALAQLSMSIMVSIGGGDDKLHGVPGVLMLDPLEIIITVFENPLLNRGSGGAGITCNRAVEVIARVLKMKRVGSAFLAKPRLRLVDDDKIKDCLAKAVTFRMSATL